jgi:hypothetical protein
MINKCTILIRDPEENRPLGDLDVDMKIILKWMLEK